MSTISTILIILFILILYFSVSACWSGNWKSARKGILWLFIAPHILALSQIIHVRDYNIKLRAENSFRKDDARLISTHFSDEVGNISDAAAEIKRQRDGIRTILNDLEKKAADVQDAASKKMLEAKMQNLNTQVNRLDASLNQLEQCAFEQVLLNFVNELPGEPGVAADFQYQVNKELRTMQQVMQEVENMK